MSLACEGASLRSTRSSRRPCMPYLTYVLPRQMRSLHPGAKGNPAFSEMDIAPQMRWVFYASATGFLLLAWWIYTIRVRAKVADIRLQASLADAD